MKPTQLQVIINRLTAMVNDKRQEEQVRQFEIFGLLVGTVIYNHSTGLFTVVDNKNNQEYIFDDLDLVAVEIFDAINRLKITF